MLVRTPAPAAPAPGPPPGPPPGPGLAPGPAPPTTTARPAAPGMEVFAGHVPVPMQVPGERYGSLRPWFITEQADYLKVKINKNVFKIISGVGWCYMVDIFAYSFFFPSFLFFYF